MWTEAKAAFEARIAAGDKTTQVKAWSGLGLADYAEALAPYPC